MHSRLPETAPATTQIPSCRLEASTRVVEVDEGVVAVLADEMERRDVAVENVGAMQSGKRLERPDAVRPVVAGLDRVVDVVEKLHHEIGKPQPGALLDECGHVVRGFGGADAFGLPLDCPAIGLEAILAQKLQGEQPIGVLVPEDGEEAADAA